MNNIKLSNKIVDLLNKKYNDYIIIDNIKKLKLLINNNYDVIYVCKNRIYKCIIKEIMCDTIIKIIQKNKIRLIYLNDKLFLFRKKNDLRSILNNIIKNQSI
jgi:hypothetical protein